MKASQIVGLVLGLILIALALIAFVTGSVDPGTDSGAISLLFAVILGVFVIVSSLSEKKPKKAPSTPPQDPSKCPKCGGAILPGYVACPMCGTAITNAEELPPPPDDYVPPPTAPAPKRLQKQQVTAVVVIAVVAIVVVFFVFGGSLFGAKWKGTCTYYYLDIYGERDSKISGTCEMTLKLSGDSASGTLDITPTTQVDVGPSGYVPAVAEHIRFSGDYDGTQLSFFTEMTFGPDAGTAKDHWVFTISGNNMVGQVTNLDTYAYIGLDSDAGAFVLTK